MQYEIGAKDVVTLIVEGVLRYLRGSDVERLGLIHHKGQAHRLAFVLEEHYSIVR